MFRSKRFAGSIIESLERLQYPNLEILISDRHCEDDTLELLKNRYGADSRFRFFAETDQLDWVGHFNFLLTEGRGTYFRWMPHDDLFPVCNLMEIVDYLEHNPDAVLVWGPTRKVDLDGKLLWMQKTPGPDCLEPWTFDIPVLLNFANYCLGAFKGLFRRNLVVRHGLTIRPTYVLQYSERCWLFAMSLLGRFHFMENYDYWKQAYPESTHAQWKPDVRNIFSQFWVMQRYLWRLEKLWRNRLVGAFFMLPLTLRSASIAAFSNKSGPARSPVPAVSPRVADKLKTWILRLSG